MHRELKGIIEKLNSDYNNLKDEFLCCSGPVYGAYENATDTFINHVVEFINVNIPKKDFFMYVLSSYKELEEISVDKESKKIIDNSFVINDLIVYSRCNCLNKYRNIIDKKNIYKHEEMIRVCNNYGASYVGALKNAKLSLFKSNEKLLVISNLNDAKELYDFIYKYYYYEPVHTNYNLERIEFLKKYYIYYHIINTLIEKYNRDQPKTFKVADVDIEKITEIYKENGVLIRKDDIQFDKYELLSLNNNVKIKHNDAIGAIYDDRISKSLIVHTSKEILDVFSHLMDVNYIKNISLKPMSIQFFGDGLESIERGSPLISQIKKLPDISCFFDISYENKLIIIHNKEKKEITFEELRGDFTLEGDSIITQVVHLKYNESNDNYIIEHLDHEYIFYSLDEYEKKSDNITQKGSYGKIKTFKIDNSSIPFFYRYKGSYFLFIILEWYFINKDLLFEYFEGKNLK